MYLRCEPLTRSACALFASSLAQKLHEIKGFNGAHLAVDSVTNVVKP
jgi:hypothetical protein